MRIRVLQLKKEQKARNLVRSLRYLADARHDLPMVRPSEFLGRGRLPGLPSQVKLHALILHPHERELQGWDLARAAVDILEERHGAILDWACGFRISGAVWVLIKPWASDAETWKRKWFWVTPEDLKAIREELAEPRPARAQWQGRRRERGRG